MSVSTLTKMTVLLILVVLSGCKDSGKPEAYAYVIEAIDNDFSNVNADLSHIALSISMQVPKPQSRSNLDFLAASSVIPL